MEAGSSSELGAPELCNASELGRARAIYDELCRRDIGDCVELSNEGTEELNLTRRGFTYGETPLVTLLRMLRAADLPSFCCNCTDITESSDDHERCGSCGKRRAGAVITDCGSGVGNAVVSISLLVAAQLIKASSVRGVELLPPLHRAACETLEEMRCKFSTAAAEGRSLLRAQLPLFSVACADLTSHDLSDDDILYLCSTAFTSEVEAQFSSHAAKELRIGSRIITLSRTRSSPPPLLTRNTRYS